MATKTGTPSSLRRALKWVLTRMRDLSALDWAMLLLIVVLLVAVVWLRIAGVDMGEYRGPF